MPSPLNPLLYEQLQRRFGKVLIANPGIARVGSWLPDPYTKKETYVVRIKGEQYRINCPHCTDTRMRCYISYCWGHRDERGRLNLHLINCRNENCFAADPRNAERRRVELYERLSVDNPHLAVAEIKPGEILTEAQVVDMPGPTKLLHELPPDHPANVYLAGRMYQPELLGRFYRVGYCEYSRYPLAEKRIVAPLYQGGKLKGWQCRYVGELDWKNKEAKNPPKWYGCPNMQKGLLLYNLDNAKKYKTGVLVEGSGDVWGFGPMAMGAWGSDVSDWQQHQFVAGFKSYSGVLLMDPDVQKDETPEQKAKKAKYEAMYKALCGKFRYGLASVVLPDGYDPGSMDRTLMRQFVAREAKAQGVKVWWTPR